MKHIAHRFFQPFTLPLLLCLTAISASAAEVFTLQIGSAAAPPVPVVDRADTWRYHLGTNAPISGWKTNADASLDADSWGIGAGGFGYSTDNPNETANCGTVLNNMLNRTTTLYTRRTFEITETPDPSQNLRLTVDYDDGFVAYLDGVEIRRGNVSGTVDVEPSNTAIASGSHEASTGNSNNSPQPPSVSDLGPVGSRLNPGTHVLSVIGLNRSADSSDFILVADLDLVGGAGGVLNGKFFSLVDTNTVNLFGSNTIAGATRVVVNGLDAAFNPGQGTWAKSMPLVPGMNRLFIAVLDANGNILTSTNRDLIYQASTTSVGGPIALDTTWTSAMGVIRVTNDVIVPTGVTLSVAEDVIVLLGSGVSIRATAGGTVDIAGTENKPTYFLPADGTSNWGAINANGLGAMIRARHIETAAGAITFNNEANGLIEDSYLHDRGSILTANSAGLITTRRIHVQRYDETIYNSGTLVLAEDSLYEDLNTSNADCLEIQGGQPGSIVRRNTFRRSTGGNSDGVDFNGTSGALIDSCIIHDISDKGISLGASGQGGSPDLGIQITNCLIYRVENGLALKDSSTATLHQSTISQSGYGLNFYQKFTSPVGGGRLTNAQNNIIWGNTVSAEILDGGVALLEYSDVQGTNWPGTGNISADPLFVDPGRDDFRLGSGSPALGTGLGGVDMGVRFPVGGLPSKPQNLAAQAVGLGPIQIWWQENADNESGFAIERSTDAANWQALAGVSANVTNYTDNTGLVGQLYFYRVRATNSSGNSRFSNLASAIRQAPVMFVGGTLSSNTVWSPTLGTYIVLSNIIVPTNISLTIQAGTIVKLTNNVAITAQAGGAIYIVGTAENKVVLERWNGTNNWAEIRADGTNAMLVIRHADISGGQTTIYFGASGLLEDTYFHDFRQQGAGTIFNQPIVLTHYAASAVMRRCHLNNYHETLWRHGVHIIEDCLFENMVGDALDFDAAFPGSIVRRCSFRHGKITNVDAMDVGNDGASHSAGVTVDSCLMYDFPFDKGVSIGEGSQDIVVTNCLMYGCNWGIGVKDNSTAGLYNNTISGCDEGFRCYNKIAGQGSGIVTNSFNNVLWGNPDGSIVILDGGSIVVSYSDLQGTNWPGAGNISSDPLFVDVAERDYRLSPGSPALGTGRNGEDMGAHFPVGSIYAPSHPVIQSVAVSGSSAVVRFWADSEKTYSLLSSDAASGGSWTKLTDIDTNTLPRLLSFTNTVSTQRFYRLVTPKQP